MLFRAAALGLLLLSTPPPEAAAAPFSLDVSCDALRLVRRGDDLAVLCAQGGQGFTVAGIFRLCPAGVRASRLGNDVFIRCRQ